MARIDPEVLGEIVKDCIGLPHRELLEAVTKAVDKRYPKLHVRKNRKWHWSNAGGAMLQISFLYGSLTEYLLFAHTAIGTEGHTGIYLSRLWDWVLEGEMWHYGLGDGERTVYRAGDMGYLGRGGGGEGFCVKDNMMVLEYARGFVPLMMPFGLADSIFSTLDIKSVLGQSLEYTKLCTGAFCSGDGSEDLLWFTLPAIDGYSRYSQSILIGAALTGHSAGALVTHSLAPGISFNIM